MLRARYPLLAFATFAFVVVGYIFLTGRTTTESFRKLIHLQARQVADLVAEVAQRNDEVRRNAERLIESVDDMVLAVLGSQVAEEDRIARLRRTVRGRLGGRVLLVEADGTVLLDEGGPRRPGKRDLAAGETTEEGRMLRYARQVAAGIRMADQPPEDVAPFELHPRRRVFRRVGKYCLVIVRSEAALETMRLETGLDQVLDQFRNDSQISYVRVEDKYGRLAAGFGERGSAEVEEDRLLEMSSGNYTLRVGVNTDTARAVERRAGQVPLLVGVALIVLGGAAMALVFRLQAAYIKRERDLVARGEQDRRLASLGRLTAGVAHEIKNPLNTIQLSVGRLQRRAQDVDPKILAAITRSVQTIATTVEDFMKLARDPGLVLEPGDPGAVLKDAVSQVRPMAATAGRNIEISAAATHVKVRLDAARLKEALVNLLRNAVQASQSKVEVRLRQDEGACRIHIDDDGSGIPEPRRAEIFEFFYTTKESGTGLGLPLAHRVAEEHGGTLEVGDAPLGGARFTLRLPCL